VKYRSMDIQVVEYVDEHVTFRGVMVRIHAEYGSLDRGLIVRVISEIY